MSGSQTQQQSIDAKTYSTQEQQQWQQQQNLQNAKAPISLRQSPFVNVLFVISKLKAWPGLLIFVPIVLALSNVYFPLMYKWFERYSSEQADDGKVAFYGASNLAKSEDTVLVDSSTFPDETGALASIMADRGGGQRYANWMQHCTPAKECQARFISEHNASVVGYMNYSRSSETGGSNLGLECHMTGGSSRKCAFLYQLMAQSISKTSTADGVFKEVQFFTITIQHTTSTRSENATMNFPNISLPESFCAALFRRDPKLFESIINGFVSTSLGITTLGLNFYFFLSTLPAIRAIKTDGFLQKLVRIGLSPTLYWSVIWLLTVAECALVSGVYTLALFLQCPGFYPVQTMPNVWAYVFFYCISLAAMKLLLEMLISSLAAISMLSLAIAVALMFAFYLYDQLVLSLPKLCYVLPLASAKKYIVAYLTSDLVRRTSGSNPVIGSHYVYQLVAIVLTALVLGLTVSYLDCCLSTGNGLFLPKYFPFSIRFWSPSHVKVRGEMTFSNSKRDPEPHIEQIFGFMPSIKIQRVFKSYNATCSCSPEFRVLNGLSCKIFKNQITALIGHNGAGKSTLIKVITGEEILDGGAAYIDGIKVTDPLDRLALRGSVTICPQFDALCDELTVSESLQATLNCRGVCSNIQEEKARDMLWRLGLGDKESVKTSDLSGGQKRKLNVILALLGDPQVVFLDEPTSGLDPVSRRQLWQLLQEEKIGRSIVLCTQFMDEADVLADRKIFLCGGEIICAGSSMFLKRAFGCSFTLNVSLKSKADAQKVVSRLNGVQVKSQFETELQFEVPAAKPDLLIEAVQALESSQDIKAFGLSQANLDDIFMKLSDMSSFEIIDAFQSGELSKFYNKSSHDAFAIKFAGQSQPLGQSQCVQPSVFKQFAALFRTNLYRQTRSASNIFSRFVIPAMLLAVIGFSVMKSSDMIRSVSNKMSPADNYLQNSGVRLSAPKHFDYFVLNYICIHNETEGNANTSFCSHLTFKPEGKFIAVSKPGSIGLRDFLSQNSTILTLQQACFNESQLILRGCVIYHASSWDKAQPNSMRKLAVGWLEYDTNHIDTVYVYVKAFVMLSDLFGAGSESHGSEASVSLIKPLSQFNFLSSHAEIFLLLVVFTLFPVSYLSDPIEDVTSRVRSHMKTMGMTDLAYWANTFVLHWLQYSVCFVISVCLMCIWSRYRNVYFILACLPTLLLGTTTNQMTIYTFSTIARRENPIVFVFCNLYAVFLPVILGTLGINKAVLVLICLIPPMAPIALIYYSVLLATYCLQYYRVEAFSQIPDLNKSNWSSIFILTSLFAMPIHICLMICIIVIVERSASIRASCCPKTPAAESEEGTGTMDPGAQKEADRVLQSPRNPKNVLEVRQLCKTYPNGVRAVSGVTFDTMAGETFGLLGANGAGKSTTMSVIIGQEAPSSGVCEVRMKCDDGGGSGAWKTGASCALIGTIGYCPQYNPLFENITVTEHMSLYADIRGVPAALANRQVTTLIQGLGLEKSRNQYAGQLSSGKKRRLCLAIALLGDPTLILIDEASTGVDPENKRFIWNVIRGMLNDQRSVMVTTHSMEEVEALCSRVGIMNNGRMIAIGTVQHLRSLHGDAYTLEVLVPQESTDKPTAQRKAVIKAAIASQFKGAVLLEDLSQCLQFCIPKTSVNRLSAALQWLAANQSKLGMEYYSLYQMSLDQVFVKLVKQFDKVLDQS